MKPKNDSDVVIGSTLITGVLFMGLGFMFLGFLGGIGAGLVGLVIGGMTAIYVKF